MTDRGMVRTEAKPSADRLDIATFEQVVVGGDLSKLTAAQRVVYYRSVCESLGLNPLTRPFQYIRLRGEAAALTLYATRDATDQLRRAHGISLRITAREERGDVYVVTASATNRDSRTDESTGVVSIAGLRGDALANAYMKAETKAKRRVTLSIVGLGWLDETETETVPDAMPVSVDTVTGEIAEAPHQPRPTAPTQPMPGSRLERLRQRWGELWHEATIELSLDPRILPVVKQSASENDLIMAGRELAEIIAKARAGAEDDATGGEEAD